MEHDFRKVDGLMQKGVDQRIFPGAVILVAVHGAIKLQRAYGMANIFSRRAMTLETVFDLASLTKPLATTLAVMHLVQNGRLALDQPAGDYWPLIGRAGKSAITIRHLLGHCSGLPAWHPYYLRLASIAPDRRRQLLQEWIASEPLVCPPGECALYSDIGFIVLQWIVEIVSGQPLDQFFHSCIVAPLATENLFFIPLTAKRPDRFYAATELCPLRGRLLIGEVHDDNAHVLGGVSGHAGLFGTAEAVWSMLQRLLSADRGEAVHPLYDQALIRKFFQRSPNSSWALGFDTPSASNSSAGHCFSPHSVGHLGYAGTSFWMARDQAVVVIVLTNRVHPSRYDFRIKQFRPILHDTVMAELGLA